ncbi:MAG: YdcF family protein [Roseibium sp.]|uniref:YdcF family protein n=1 Tax=Roseibium sp. TaxID=1936156 RepID=UPI001B1E26F6|nr:YdcF family protein [Roseibium sp.]MBO6894325.1 YdcF family protein [Roseibium sp.]MBO6931899.1 YdcF family protein [Roseibium sp.]
MFFYVAKVGYFFLQPSNFLIGLVLLGLLLVLVGRWRKLGIRCAWLGVVGLSVCGFSPAANWLILPLEERFPRPATLEGYEGIIVLGGAVDTIVTGGRGDTALTTSGERITITARLAQQIPDARVVHTGGKGVIVSAQATEAEGAARLFEDFGIAPDRILLEDASRNTWENAVLTKALVKPEPGQSWLLVTSAYHMPRSMGVFRKAGWTGITAYPVDYRTRGSEDWTLGFSGASKGLRRFDVAFKEWIGLVVYRVTGRSTEFFPGPTS